MLKTISLQLTSELIEIFPQLKAGDIEFQPPPDNRMGDIALPCFNLGKKLDMSPHDAAKFLAGKMGKSPLIKKVKANGPYLNFFFMRELFAIELHDAITSGGHFGSSSSGKGQKVLMEHTSINPNASPHVGRARNGLIGDSLARIMRYEGYDVDVHYYINDMGKQIALLVMECEGKDNLHFDEILSIYVKANKKAAEDTEYEEKAFALLKKFEEHDPETTKKFKIITDLCVKGQLAILSRLNISYDYFDHESDFVHDPKVEAIESRLHTAGSLFVDEHGRKVVDLKKLGYGNEDGRYFVLKRGNGSTMYGYRDIAYTINKLSKCSDNNIIILGEDHKLYFQQLGLILNAVDLVPPEVIHYSYIVLKDGKMSTRKGNVVLLKDFLDEAIARVKERVDTTCSHLSEKEKNTIATMIGIGAVKFSILRVNNQKNVIFDLDSALTFEGDTGPYVQYTCVRIASILRKAKARDLVVSNSIKLETELEWELLLKLAEFDLALASAIELRKPAFVVDYSLNLSRKFNEFYTNCPVLKAEDIDVCSTRIHLCNMTHQVLNIVLSLLGIDVPEYM